MNHPDRENTLTLLGDWQKHHAVVEKMMNSIKTSIGLDPEGPMFDAVWKLFDAYTGALTVEIGDASGWMEWYQLENDMGAKGMAAGYDGKLRKIKTLAHLYSLIAESRKWMAA
jgi:hypothetical protein